MHSMGLEPTTSPSTALANCAKALGFIWWLYLDAFRQDHSTSFYLGLLIFEVDHWWEENLSINL